MVKSRRTANKGLLEAYFLSGGERLVKVWRFWRGLITILNHELVFITDIPQRRHMDSRSSGEVEQGCCRKR
jgi:hypothetical protein